ncbi:MAG: type I restriction enzyme M protein [Alteromonadaceae bacterium]|jgi:type I restriction enzyme M protein
MTDNNFSQTAAFLWSVADLLRGDFKQSQYGRVILPFTLLRRLECVLSETKEAVLKVAASSEGVNEVIVERNLIKAAGHKFYNTSEMDMSKLGLNDVKDNLPAYILSFSDDAREIFEYFRFSEFVQLLADADLLYKVVKMFAHTDLSPQAITNHDMGLVFEELIRRFAESSNETAGEHFTPRDIVELTTALAFMQDDEVLTQEAAIRTIYDPTAGTGGFLSAGMEYVHKLNPQAVILGFGQELNPESYAICKGDMLVKAQKVDNIKLGNTLSNDQLGNMGFDYMLSNPPFGVDWKKIEESVNTEHANKGYEGRFGPGLPRVSDGSLLFLLHLIDKMKAPKDGGSRIGIILNGSPLFTGGAGSGESEIRRFILQQDLLEAIIALPTDMFYNTGIATYIWVLSNKKVRARKGRVQLIDGSNLYGKMRKSLGSKRNVMSDDDIATITRAFGGLKEIEAYELDKQEQSKSNRGRQAANAKTAAPKTFASKIFNNHQFGYRRITIERPLRESFAFTDERIASLRFAAKPLNAPMQWLYESYVSNKKAPWSDAPECANYGQLNSHDKAIRAHFKKHFSSIKEKQIKTLLNPAIWLEHKQALLKAKQLQQQLGFDQHNDMNTFDEVIKGACNAQGIKLEAKEKKLITTAVSWINQDAVKVIKKVHKDDTKAKPLYGLFAVEGAVVEYKTDGNLRDNENVDLDPTGSINGLNEAYFKREVQPHVPDAWIDANKTDDQDHGIGIVGYEIPFNRHFYQYQPPRPLEEIDADLDAVSADIMRLLQEVHS